MGDGDVGAGTLIAVRDLVKTYSVGEQVVKAIRGVTLDIARGEFVAIMGPSGSGKTTFMNLLGCLEAPTSGSYRLEGADVSALDRNARAAIRRTRIGFVFQTFNLLPRTSALDNVALPLVYNRVPAPERRVRALVCLREVGLEGREAHYPSQLSGGQQQRVAIARALVNTPALVLADELTGNLDTRTSVEIMAVLQKLNRGGITIVVVTHEGDVARFARRLITFRDGLVRSDRPVRAPAAAEELLQTLPPNEAA